MGGYPALMIRPPESPVQQLAGVQQVQQQALQIQQERQQIADQHALTTAMQNYDGKNPDTLPMLVLKAGGSGTAAMSMSKNVLEIKSKASEIAKNDSITAQNATETLTKQNDEYRGKIQSIIGITDPVLKQQEWDKEMTQSEQDGHVKPGQVSHTYPGDAKAEAFANHFALGSQLTKEAQEKQKLALDAWKSVGGQLINAITEERIGGLGDVNQLNKGLESRWQVLHPSEPLPEQFTLKATANPEDFNRVDKLLEATEKGTATKAQQDTVNAIKQQTFEMMRDKADLQAVVGTDPKTGRAVMAPMGQAQQMGLQNSMKAPEDTVNKALAARHWLTLAQKQAPEGAKPEEMGIQQLVDNLDKEGKLGPLASRWNEFMAGKFGAGDPEYAALRTKMGLSTTLLMQAHVGSRGSSQMLEHFEDLANAKKLDGPTLKTAVGSEVDYVKDRAMDPNPPDYSAKAPAKATAGGAKSLSIQAPNGKTYHFKDQESLNNFKKEAGIK